MADTKEALITASRHDHEERPVDKAFKALSYGIYVLTKDRNENKIANTGSPMWKVVGVN